MANATTLMNPGQIMLALHTPVYWWRKEIILL